MYERQIRRALGAFRRPGSTGPESAAGAQPSPERADELAEQALAALPLASPGSASKVEAARASLAVALIEEGRSALKEVAVKGIAASLSSDQIVGLEAIVRLTGRPSILVRDGSFEDVPPDWEPVMSLARELIETSIASVGRLNVPEFGDVGYLGTAFMVAEDLALTNAHVGITFAERAGSAWKVGTGLTPTVDFIAEDAREVRREYRVTGIVGIHTDPRIDVALLRLSTTGFDGSPLPRALTLNGDPNQVKAGGTVYVIGYPAYDDRNDSAAIEAIFGRSLSVKRIAPGEIIGTRYDGLEFTHDCSTLKGNSGSCIVDFATHRVLGLHRSGTFGEENRAVSMAHVRDDSLLSGKGIDFRD